MVHLLRVSLVYGRGWSGRNLHKIAFYCLLVLAQCVPAILFGEASDMSPVLRVGLIVPLTGSRAGFGADVMRGAELARSFLASEVKTKGFELELVVEDSEADPRKGVAAFESLKQKGIKAVITQHSNVSIAVEQLASRDGILQIAIITGSIKYSTPNDLSFRVNAPSSFEAEPISDFVAKRYNEAPAPVGLLSLEDEYSLSLKDALILRLREKNIPVAFNDSFLSTETDFRSVLLRAKKAGVQYFVFFAYPPQAGTIVRRAQETGFKPRMQIGSWATDGADFFAAAGAAANGVFITKPGADASHPAARAFRDRFARDADATVANGYDSVVLATKAFLACVPALASECMKKSLFAVKDYHGLGGTIGFDDVYGDPRQEHYRVWVAQEGKWVLLEH